MAEVLYPIPVYGHDANRSKERFKVTRIQQGSQSTTQQIENLRMILRESIKTQNCIEESKKPRSYEGRAK